MQNTPVQTAWRVTSLRRLFNAVSVVGIRITKWQLGFVNYSDCMWHYVVLSNCYETNFTTTITTYTLTTTTKTITTSTITTTTTTTPPPPTTTTTERELACTAFWALSSRLVSIALSLNCLALSFINSVILFFNVTAY